MVSQHIATTEETDVHTERGLRRDGEQRTNRTGGQLVVDSLVKQGVTRISCVPGESFLPVLDAALGSPIIIDASRHEAGAGNMAVATAKLTGRVGVVAASRGPGALHAAISVHTAEQDALPLLLLIGQVALKDRGRGGFQEVDFIQVFGSIAKWVVSLDTVERIPETIARAVRIAEGGRPGPVVVEMPEDVLAQVTTVADVEKVVATSPAPSPVDVERMSELLKSAQQPLIILGRSRWDAETSAFAEAFAKTFTLPVLAGFRCQDYIDNASAFYGGHLGFGLDSAMRARLNTADLIVSIGGHFGDVETQGYELINARDGLTVAHVTNSEHDLDRYVHADLAIEATPAEFFRAMLDRAELTDLQHEDSVKQADGLGNITGATALRVAWVEAIRREETERSTPPVSDDLLGEIMGWLEQQLPENAIIANGAGNYAIWLHRFHKYRRFGTQLAPASGAMGYGLPAGIAATRTNPSQPVLVFAGDGCFSMAMNELSVLMNTDANITIIVVNNGIYGTIRMHQERHYPARVSATNLTNPDFVALAQSYGFNAGRAQNVDEFAALYERFAATGGPRLIEVITDPARLSPTMLLNS